MKIPPLLSDALLPLSAVYETIVAARVRKYSTGRRRPAKLEAVVISVGNLTVGGTGKTPFTIYIMKRLREAGKNAAVLMRGYRGRSSPGRLGHNKQRLVSDESLLIADSLPGEVKIGLDSDRYRMGTALAAAGVDWFVLDDGFQHVKLARDVNILLLDATVPLSRARLLPAGPFREHPKAMNRADLLVITRSLAAPEMEAQIRRYTSAPVFHAQTSLRQVRRIEGDSTVTDTSWKQRRLFAFCGIGNANSFFADVERFGIPVVGRRAFSDHHRYSPRDLRKLEAAARAAQADALLCTQKDRFNLHAAGSCSLPIFVCEVEMKPDDEAAFWDAFREILARKRPEARL